MITGTSISHVQQDEGLCYRVDAVEGYYNNLTQKVSLRNAVVDVPQSKVDTGELIFFSIEIFQYGLGAYDLYLQTQEETMLKKTLACADWAVQNQQENGGWITFAYKNPDQPYSAMAQGEGISLLLRAYLATKNECYLEAAKKAKKFMLLPLEQGGTTGYTKEEVYLYECTFCDVILNGWIFALWGLWDYCNCIQDTKAEQALSATLRTLEKKLPDFDMKYWSKYEDGKRICSPFYHRLHIAQLRVMHDLTGTDIYSKYADLWEMYQQHSSNRIRAFIKKAFQKIVE